MAKVMFSLKRLTEIRFSLQHIDIQLFHAIIFKSFLGGFS